MRLLQPMLPRMAGPVLPTLMMVPPDDADRHHNYNANAEVMAVALPILAACLAEPTLSMIDTACVGRLTGAASSANLAALNANAAIFNLLSVSTSFLCTATTAVVGRSNSITKASQSFRDGLVIAMSIGTLLMLCVLVNRDVILCRGLGLPRASAAFLPAARYLQIRALSLPAVATTLVAVGVSLGLQDSVTPLFGVLLAFAVNVVGDLLCVWHFGWGLAGAAVATACASYASCFLICGALARRLKPVRWRRAIKPRELLPFVTCSGALLAGTSLNAATYTSSSRVVAASGIVSEAATHQLALQGWWLLSFASVPLSLAGQSLLPKLASEEPRRAEATVATLFRFGVACALLMAASNALLTTRLATLFSMDSAVLAPLRALTVTVVLSQASVSLATALDGAFIGCGWLRHYMAACLAGTAAALLVMARGMRAGGGLVPAWRGLLVFSLLRLIAHLVQLPRLQKALRERSA